MHSAQKHSTRTRARPIFRIATFFAPLAANAPTFRGTFSLHAGPHCTRVRGVFVERYRELLPESLHICFVNRRSLGGFLPRASTALFLVKS